MQSPFIHSPFSHDWSRFRSPRPSTELRTTPFFVLFVNYCTLYVELCIYVIYIRRDRYHSVGKQEREPITMENSKVRVVIRRNLRRKESDANLDKKRGEEGYHRGHEV